MNVTLNILRNIKWWPVVFTAAIFVLQPVFAVNTTTLKPVLLMSQNSPLPTLPISADERQWLNANAQLRVGIVANDLPPFDMVDLSGAYQGISAEYINFIAQTLNLRPVVTTFSTQTLAQQALIAGTIDMVSTSSGHDAGPLAQSIPYYQNRTIEVTVGSTQLNHNKPGVLAISTTQLNSDDVRRYYPLATVIEYPSIYQALDAVEKRTANAYIGNATSAAYLMESYHFTTLGISNFAAFTQPGFTFVMRDDTSPRLALINRTLALLPAHTEGNIAKHWISLRNLYGAVHAINLTPAEKLWLQKNREVKYSSSADHMPFVFTDTSQAPAGLSIQLLDLIAQRTGLTFTPVWTDNIDSEKAALLKQEIQLIPMLLKDTNYFPYNDQILSSASYFTAQWVVVGRKNDYSFLHLSDLANKRIAVMPPNPLVDRIIEHIPGTQAVIANSYLQSYQMVANDQADFTIANVSTARYNIEQYFPSNLHIVGPFAETPIEISFGVIKEAPELLSIINKALSSISPAELDNITSRWTALSHPDSGWQRYRAWVLWGGAAIIMGLSIFFIWIFFLLRQIRARTKAESALRDQLGFQEALMNGIPHPVYVRDHQGRFLNCNHAYEKAVGATKQELMGMRPREMQHWVTLLDELGSLDELYGQLLATGVPLSADRSIYANGEIRDVYSWAVRLTTGDNNIAGFVGGWIDITERAQLLADLKSAQINADKANRAKSIYLTTISHELRTPMNALVGMLELLLSTRHTPEKTTLYLDTAHNSAASLLTLIDDILDWSKLDVGKLSMRPEPVMLRTLIDEAIQMFNPVAHQAALSLTAKVDASVALAHMADPVRIRQILNNLVGNALKFTESGGITITLACCQDTAQEQTLLLTVTDTGIGIAEGDLPKLFQPFSQADSTINRVSGGTGLGLSICQRLARKMGGDITLQSQVGEGTRIEVTVTLAKCAPPAPRSRSALAPDRADNALSGYTILVIDDHPSNSLVLLEQLRHLGCQAMEAENGEQGLAHCAAQSFDLIFCDCNMPVMDGCTFTTHLRAGTAGAQNQHTPVLGYTANASDTHDHHKRVIAAGMQECLVKPIPMATLEQILHRYLGTDNRIAPPISTNVPSSPLTTTEPVASAVYDQTRLDQLTIGKPDNERRLLASLGKVCHDDLATLHHYIEAHDWVAIKPHAHRIKGAANLIGATALITACMNVEDALGSDAQVTLAADVLASELKKVTDALQTALAAHAAVL